MTDLPSNAAPQPAQPPADPAFADLCHVERHGNRVQMSFGRRVPSELVDDAEGVQLQQQIGLAAAGAAQLQDMLLALLQATPPGPGAER